MSAFGDFEIMPVKRTPFWLRLMGKPKYRQWVWTWSGWGASDGYWKYYPEHLTVTPTGTDAATDAAIVCAIASSNLASICVDVPHHG